MTEMQMPLLEACGVSRLFAVRGSAGLFRARNWQRAVDDVTLAIHPGEVVAVVGESGSGKTTLGRMLLGLTPPSEGIIRYHGTDIASLQGAGWQAFRRDVQVVFQDTGGSLNPRHTVADSIALPLRYNLGLKARALEQEIDSLMNQVGLAPAHFRQRLPHELSGGQRQRVGIARALASRPAVLFADEPTGNLDSHTGEEVLRLLRHSSDKLGQTIVMVTHDAHAATYADRIVFLSDGAIAHDCGRLGRDEIYDVIKSLEDVR